MCLCGKVILFSCHVFPTSTSPLTNSMWLDSARFHDRPLSPVNYFTGYDIYNLGLGTDHVECGQMGGERELALDLVH